jgi:transcriptional regulator with XRE-family HTH domain
VKSFGELIAKRRKELGLTQTELAQRIMGRRGGPISQERITDIEHNRYGVPRKPILEQLARELQLDSDVLYLWGRIVPPDIDPEGVPEVAIQLAWRFFRAAIADGRKQNDSDS